MSEKILKAICLMVDENDLTEIELTRESLELKLVRQGFSSDSISYVLDWIANLNQDIPKSPAALAGKDSLRTFTDEELDLIDPEFLNYIMKIESMKLINQDERELILDKLKLIDNEDLSEDSMRFLIAMILFGTKNHNNDFLFTHAHEPEILKTLN
jgi:uncharacterized protein Smg (DUF494 family)